jgi:PKD repeat protein
VLALLPAVAGADTSTAPNPVVVFTTPGDQTVTLEACNTGGCATGSQTVRVLDPMPHITSATLGATAVEVGQLVSLTGAATGRPALSYSWAIKLGAATIATLAGSSTSLDTSGLAVGAYTVTLTVSNAHGADTSAPLGLTLGQSAAEGFYTVVPCRLLDTRGGLPLTAGGQLLIFAVGSCGVPTGARALAANVTVVDATGSGEVTVVPGDVLSPTTSSVSFRAGHTRSSFAVLTLDRDGAGTLAAFADLSAGGVHLILDVTGYFVPLP